MSARRAHALQAKIDAESMVRARSKARWEHEREEYLANGDIDRLRFEAMAFYRDEKFSSIQEIIISAIVDISTLTAERSTRLALASRPTIHIDPSAISVVPGLATGGLVKRSAALPLLGDSGPSARSYGDPSVLDYPIDTPEPDCD